VSTRAKRKLPFFGQLAAHIDTVHRVHAYLCPNKLALLGMPLWRAKINFLLSFFEKKRRIAFCIHPSQTA